MPLVPLARAWYSAEIDVFVCADPNAVLGALVAASSHDVDTEQSGAWRKQVDLLQACLRDDPAARRAGQYTGHVHFEFGIPRMGRRIDTVLVIGPVVIALEFKVGARRFEAGAISQVWDYALDLKNFHEGSHELAIVPVLVATEAPNPGSSAIVFSADGVAVPVPSSGSALGSTLARIIDSVASTPIDHNTWLRSAYKPTPTIIEAARALYAQHSVAAIARNDAGATNLHATSIHIERLIDRARANNEKIVCFVTGVPGAGKTLVGLDIATKRRDGAAETHAVFLSGNGPLVAVLREALTRDEHARLLAAGGRSTKAGASKAVKAFIQNVHHFRDEALINAAPPADHVAIFDEAQRAWNSTKTAQFMQQKKGYAGFNMSEPTFLLSYMDRHKSWAVVVCLVGGGQEIHTGEAGISEWIRSAVDRFPDWHLHISNELFDSEYTAGNALAMLHGRANTQFERDLHLAVSMRSFRAENVSRFVKALLDCDVDTASDLYAVMGERYPICISRSLQRARGWLRERARGSERAGLMASSKAMRLKPFAIDIRVSIDPVHWFLDDADDTRSSQFLEDCATEFQVQGLEVDWACVNWDGDFRHGDISWSCHDFRGNRWVNINSAERQMYMKNAYRVLLTRARQGMVLFIPEGEPTDPTRRPEFYDGTFTYLASLGLPVI